MIWRFEKQSIRFYCQNPSEPWVGINKGHMIFISSMRGKASKLWMISEKSSKGEYTYLEIWEGNLCDLPMQHDEQK